MQKIEKGTKCLVDNSSPSTRFKLSIKGGTDDVDKDHLLIAVKLPSEPTEDSQSSNDDRKRPKKSNKQSIDDEKN